MAGGKTRDKSEFPPVDIPHEGHPPGGGVETGGADDGYGFRIRPHLAPVQLRQNRQRLLGSALIVVLDSETQNPRLKTLLSHRLRLYTQSPSRVSDETRSHMYPFLWNCLLW